MSRCGKTFIIISRTAIALKQQQYNNNTNTSWTSCAGFWRPKIDFTIRSDGSERAKQRSRQSSPCGTGSRLSSGEVADERSCPHRPAIFGKHQQHALTAQPLMVATGSSAMYELPHVFCSFARERATHLPKYKPSLLARDRVGKCAKLD